MQKNYDHNVGMFIDDENCQACTYWDICPRRYVDCTKHQGFYWAASTWQIPSKEDRTDLEEYEKIHDVGC